MILRGDADPGVAHRDLHGVLGERRADRNRSAFRRKLDRVRQEIEEDLFELSFIPHDLSKRSSM